MPDSHPASPSTHHMHTDVVQLFRREAAGLEEAVQGVHRALCEALPLVVHAVQSGAPRHANRAAHITGDGDETRPKRVIPLSHSIAAFGDDVEGTRNISIS